MSLRLPAAVAMLLLTLPSIALADPPEPPEREPTQAQFVQARDLFVRGTSFVENGQWADAISTFSEAYELSGVPPALYNVAFALRALGRHVESRDAFEALLERHRDDLEAEMRQLSERYVEEERSRVARLVLEGLEPELRYQVRLDGTAVEDHGGRPLEVEADPGAHSLSTQTEGFLPHLWEGRLSDGQRISVFIELEPIPQGDSTTIFESPVFWIIAGVVVIAGAGITAYVLYDNAQLDCQTARCYQL